MKKPVILTLLFGGLLFLHTFILFSSSSIKSMGCFLHRMWTIDDGLPMNTVMAVAQTGDGYLWLGTESGLSRFDGVKFENFNHENTPFFPSDIVLSLMVDSGGRLWIITRQGGVIRCENGVFAALPEISRVTGKETWCIMESSDGAIWAGCGTGLFRFSEGEAEKIPLPGNLSTRAVAKLLEDRNGTIWVGSKGDGLVLIKKKGSGYESEYMGLAGMEIRSLFEDRKGALWIGTMENGLFRYFDDQLVRFTSARGLADCAVHCLYEDRFGNLWIGTDGGGVTILPVESMGTPGSQICDFPFQEEFTSSIIFAFFEDREGTLWIGTNGGGLNRLREAKITSYSKKNGLSYNNIYGVFQDSSQRIWCGTKGYGANYFDTKDNRFYTLTTADGLSSNSVVTFAEDLSGGLWLGTLGGGINRLKNGHIDHFNFPGGVTHNTFRAVYVGPAGAVLAGNVIGGIYKFTNKNFQLIADVKSRVNMLFRDSRGRLWAGTMDNGAYRMDMPAGDIKVFNEDNGLSNNLVTCIREGKEGTFWIGTARGLNRFRDGTIAHLEKKHGLPDDTVYWILEDHKKDFWISSNQGIYCLNRKEIESFFKGETKSVFPVLFGKEAGMLSIECNGGNQPAGCRTVQGKLWFPTTQGVSVIDPKHIRVNRVPPPVIIEKIIINGEHYPVNRQVVAPPGRNNLEIHFTALSFIVPNKIRFKYKMAGYEKEWVIVRNVRTVYYNDLSPGRYSFQVMACNSHGVWNHQGARVEIYLKPRFYQTLIFKIFLLLTTCSLLLFVSIYIRKLLYKYRQHKKMKNKSGRPMLDEEESQKCIRKLIYLLEEEKLYKDSNLSIKSLASRLVITPRNLSQILNDQLKSNFYEFITRYRIKEAQRMLIDIKSPHKSVLDIAYDLGYNSKSAFNRAFKEITGLTPSQYKKSISK